jgi:ketosteroid isomerase-like protein
VTRTASETVRELVDRVTRLRNGDSSQVEHLANLYAVDAHVTHPFHPEPANAATVGRAALRTHFAQLPQAGLSISSSVADWKLHTTADPEVVIAEFRYEGSIDHRLLNTRCIFVVRVVAGLIVESRDYIDHLASARAYGLLPEVLARLNPGRE